MLRVAGFSLPLLCACVVAACGSGGKLTTTSGSTGQSNGEASKTPLQVFADAKAATESASTVHIVGEIPHQGHFNLFAAGPTSGKGTASFNGFAFSSVREGNTVYFRARNAFWRHFGGATAVALIHGRWVEASVNNRLLGPTARSIYSLPTLVHSLFNHEPKPGDLVNKGVTTYRGQRVVELGDATATPPSNIYIAAAGKPYLVALVSTVKRQHAALTFSDWNHHFLVTAPRNPIRLP